MYNFNFDPSFGGMPQYPYGFGDMTMAWSSMPFPYNPVWSTNVPMMQPIEWKWDPDFVENFEFDFETQTPMGMSLDPDPFGCGFPAAMDSGLGIFSEQNTMLQRGQDTL